MKERPKADDLFPSRARIGDDGYGLDCDYRDHRQEDVTPPEKLTVTEDAEVGKIYGPCETRYRTVREDRPHVPFGFQPGPTA